MIKLILKHAYTKKRAVKYQFFENLDFDEKEPKTSGFIDFSTSNIRMTRRAYILRYISSRRVIRRHIGEFFN